MKMMFAPIVAITAGLALPAAAQEANSVDATLEQFLGAATASVALTTDYIFRGISQTDQEPAIQGSLGLGKSFDLNDDLALNLAASAWGSNVDFNDGDEASLEVDYTASAGISTGPLSVDAIFIYYAYPGANDALDYDYIEFGGAVGYDFDVAAITGTLLYSPDFFGGTGDAIYTAGDLGVPLPYDFSLAGHLGYSSFDSDSLTDYLDWSVGVTRPVIGIDLTLSYVDTDLSQSECGSGICDTAIVFTASKSF